MQNADHRLGRAKVILLLGVVLAAAMALAACGGGSSSSSESESTAATESGQNTTASETGGSEAEGGEKQQVKIAFFTYPTIPTFIQDKKGAEAAAADDGATSLEVSGPTNVTEAATRQYAENLLQSSQPEGYAVSPCLPTAFTTVWPQLESQVPNGNVLSYSCAATNSASEETPAGGTTLVSQSYAEQAKVSIEAAIKSAKMPSSTKGTALLSICVPGLASQEGGRNAARKTVEKLLPDVEVQEIATSLTTSENLAKWTSALNKYPETVLAWPFCDLDIGSLQVLKERGIGGNFLAVANGVDSPEYIKGIMNGSLSTGTAEEPWVTGYVATQLLIEGARGKKFPEGFVNAGLAEINKENAAEFLAAYESDAKAAELFKPKAEKILNDLPGHTQPLSDWFEDFPESE